MNRPEQQLQRTIVQGLRACLPSGWLVVAIPNKPRSKIAGAIEKSMGAVAGMPDVMILGSRRYNDGPSAYFVEVKAKSGRLSPEQRVIHDKLTDLGFPVCIARSWEDVVRFAGEWMMPLRIAEAA